MLELGLHFVLLIIEIGQKCFSLSYQLVFLLGFLALGDGTVLETGSLRLELKLQLRDLVFELRILRADSFVLRLESIDLGQGAGDLLDFALELALHSVQIVGVLGDLVSLLGDLTGQRLDP